MQQMRSTDQEALKDGEHATHASAPVMGGQSGRGAQHEHTIGKLCYITVWKQRFDNSIFILYGR